MASSSAKSSASIQTVRESGTLEIAVAEEEKRMIGIILTPITGDSFTYSITVTLAPRSFCDLTVLQLSSPNIPCTIAQHSALEDSARMTWRNVTLGKGKVTQDLRSEIRGADAESGVDWVFFACDSDQYQLSVRNIFLGPQGRGEIMMKGVAENKAHVTAHGMIEIGAKGSGTDTYLTQDVLMLDRTAKVDAVPGLEIKTNDVKASHSATVRHVSPEELFYFGSRGIQEGEARRVYTEGFLKELTERIGDEKVRHRILRELERKLAL